MPRLWVLMSEGGIDEVVAEVDTIDEARTALADALRAEGEDREDGELYRVTADVVEKHYRGALNVDLDVGPAAGLFEEPPHACPGGNCDDIVATYTSWQITDRDPDSRHFDPRGPQRAPRRYESDDWSEAWESFGPPTENDESMLAALEDEPLFAAP